MGKRNRPEEGSYDDPYSKRPKWKETAQEATEHITSARHLQNVLTFQQDETYLSNSLNSLKHFLNTILHPEDEYAVPRQRAILVEYLQTQQPREADKEVAYLPNLMQTWNFAATSNSDRLLSATTSAVDQLLKVLSNHIDLREYGLLLCKTVLQQAQLRILSRGVNSTKNKEHIIGPCLRVLKEVVAFDGGTLAKQLYSKRDLALDAQAVSRCLTNRRLNTTEPEDIIKKPSVRTTAIRYVLANFKFQDDGAKADMLKQGQMIRTLIDGIENDHPRIISDIVHHLMTYVVQDAGIPRRNKSFLFNERNLQSFCQLYRNPLPEAGDSVPDGRPLMEDVHDFITVACTSPEAGVVRASGWYPPTGDEDILDDPGADDDSGIDLGLDGISWYNKFAKNIPIRNSTLGEFILTLRPYAYELERQLLMAILQAAPELVAWFYRRIAHTFPFSPKLTATWVGYAASLFSTVQLPVPTLFSRMSHLPPPASIVIESIIPAPLTQKALRQCLANSSDLIKFFAVRLLVASFQKLQKVLMLFRERASVAGKLWEQAAAKLTEEFCRRCPTMLDITKLYSTQRNATDDRLLQRESTLRLLSLYFEVLPQLALEENYDISIPLTHTLQAIEDHEVAGEEEKMRLLELSHLVKIARWSPNMHWWNKPKALKYSPFITLLRVLARSEAKGATEIKSLVERILGDSDAVQLSTSPATGLDALIYSLRTTDEDKPTDEVWDFVDNCFLRYSKRPIKYDDDKEAFLAAQGFDVTTSRADSLIWFTVVEQWPFVMKSDPAAVDDISRWIIRFRHCLVAAGEEVVRRRPEDQECFPPALTKSKDQSAFLINASADVDTSRLEAYAIESKTAEDTCLESPGKISISPTAPIQMRPRPDITRLAPPPEPENHPILTRFRKKDLTTLIDSGDLTTLIQCLTSPHLSIRVQALTALQSLTTQIQTSTHPEKDMLYLLLGSLVETASPTATEKPTIGLIAAFAARAVEVLKDPTHAVYPKLNEFLNLGPSWRVRAMIAWWMAQVLHHPPGDADAEAAYWREVVWVLEWLYDGLRTTADFDILRRGAVFEKIMALFWHPALAKGGGSAKFADLVLDEGGVLEREGGLQNKIRPLILRIIARAGMVGGATTLVTGAGVVAWLRDVEVGFDGAAAVVVGEIERVILANCDGVKVREWSCGMLCQEDEVVGA